MLLIKKIGRNKNIILLFLAFVFCAAFIDHIRIFSYFLFELSLGFLCLLVFAYAIFRRKLTVIRHYIIIPFFLIIVWAVIEMFLFDGQKYAPKYFIYALIEILLVSMIAIQFTDRDNYRDLIKYTCWVFTLLAFILIGYYFSQGVFVNYNDFGQSYSKYLIGFAALSCYYLTLSERKIVYEILTLVFLIFSMLSTIRKMWLALFVAFVVMTILYLFGPARKVLKREEYRKSLLLIGSLGVSVIIGAALFLAVFPEFNGAVAQSTGGIVSSGDNLRSALNRDAIEQFKQSPVIGNGWGDRVHIEELNQNSLYHNAYLAVFVQLGLIGFLLYYGVFTYSLVRSIMIISKKPQYFNYGLFILALWLFAAVILNYCPLNRMSYYLWGPPFVFTLIFDAWEANKKYAIRFGKKETRGSRLIKDV